MANKERLYYITAKQFEEIEHMKRMYELNAELIYKLCSEERSDIEYGFTLGERHSHMRECFKRMGELTFDIDSQTIPESLNVSIRENS